MDDAFEIKNLFQSEDYIGETIKWYIHYEGQRRSSCGDF
jgi:hypothetical protein